MSTLAERLQEARTQLHLSQEYVSKQLGINRAAVSQIEQGNRKVSSEELAIFSRLYGLSTDELLEMPSEPHSESFERAFAELSLSDQKEILSLIEFKKMVQRQKGGGKD